MVCCSQTQCSRAVPGQRASGLAECFDIYGAAKQTEDEFELMDVGSAREDGLVEDQLGEGAAQTPNIDGLIVMFRAVDDLGGSVETSSHIASFVILLLAAGG